jgi:hypothetical protein
MKTWTKTVVGLLKTRKEAQFAIDDLIICGVPQEAITLRSSAVEHHVWSVEEETDIEQGIRTEGQQPGAGYLAKVRVGRADLAELSALGIPESAARYYSDEVERGCILLTVLIGEDRADEMAEVIRRHSTVEDQSENLVRVPGWQVQEAESVVIPSGGSSVRPRIHPENEPLSHATLREQLERAEVFKTREEVTADAAGIEHPFVGKEVSLPSGDLFQERDIKKFDALQHELQEGKVQELEFRQPESGAESQAGPSDQSTQQGNNISDMGDEEFERHFRATYAERGERFDEPYRSAYHFADAESASHPQLLDKEWYEVEEEIHRDWEMSHPGTWSWMVNAIHYGWDKTRGRH